MSDGAAIAIAAVGLGAVIILTRSGAAATGAAPAPAASGAGPSVSPQQQNGLNAIGGFFKATATGGPVGAATYWGQQFVQTQFNPQVRAAELGAATTGVSSIGHAATSFGSSAYHAIASIF